MKNILPTLLVLQGLIGALDTLYNHEFLERLPRRKEARNEIALHAIREVNYALLFAGLGWFAWHGTWAYVVAAFLVVQVLVDVVDEFIENRTRVLPQNERVLHFALILNLGVIATLLMREVVWWAAQPSAIVLADHGMLSWLLSAFASGALGWSIRDMLAWRALGACPATQLANSTGIK